MTGKQITALVFIASVLIASVVVGALLVFYAPSINNECSPQKVPYGKARSV